MKNYKNMLLKSLALLAETPKKQSLYLVEKGNLPVEELALEFDDLYILARGKYQEGILDKKQFDSLEFLDYLLNQLGDEENNWSNKALIVNPNWKEIRKQALICTKQLRSSGQ